MSYRKAIYSSWPGIGHIRTDLASSTTRAEHAATGTNGIRYDLKLTDHGIVGKPQAINLDDIASPPKDPAVAPFPRSDRDDYPDGNRWVEKLTIE